MDNSKLTKKDLYDQITKKIIELGFDPHSKNYRIDSAEVAEKACKNLEIKCLDFKERKICGILYKGENSTSIALNNKRSDKGRNFDCMHEVVHYWLHENNYFYCNENSNEYFEWQANEGAAQFLMPYQIFIPKFVDVFNEFYRTYKKLDKNSIAKKTYEHLSWVFNVGKTAAENRTKSLQGEILQYCESETLNGLNILSLTKQGLNEKYRKQDVLYNL